MAATRLKQFPLTGFIAVIAVTLGMFLLLYWHVYNTFRVGQTLTNEYARGLALGSQILSGHLNLMYDAHLVVLDGDRSKAETYRNGELRLQSYLEEARALAAADATFAPLASLQELSLALRQREHAALAALANDDEVGAEATLHSADYRGIGWALEARVAEAMASLNRSFSDLLQVEGEKELAALVVALVIFGLSALMWGVLVQRMRAWGQALEAEVAQRRDAEDQLGRAQQMQALGRMAAGVSHDFNNILSVVQGFLDVARNRLAEDHPAADALAKIGAAAQQGTELVRSLLTFSGRTGVEMAPVELGGLVAETARLFRETLPAAIALEVEVAERAEGYWVWGSRSQLLQVLANLVLNARDAMPEGGRLRIGLGPSAAEARGLDARWVRLRVTDTGLGIPEDLQERVFEPFFTTKPRGRGTGLGLAVVAAVVEEHQGRIRVASGRQQGADFTVDLPGIGPLSEEAGSADERGVGCVLVALADAYTQELVISALESDGYRVCAVAPAAVPREVEPPASPSLMLLDDKLPTQTLWALVEVAQRAPRRVPLVVMADAEGLSEELGTDVLILNRPFLMAELTRLIHNLVSDHGTQEIAPPHRR